jgi:hypothetical protein
LPAAAGLLMATGLGLFLLRGTSPLGGDRAGDGTGAGRGVDDPSSTAAAIRPPDEALDTAPRVDPRLPAEVDAPQGPAPNAAQALPDRARNVALFLPAGTLRGARPSVRVSPSAETVRLEIELEPPAPRFVGITLRELRELSAGAADAPSASASSSSSSPSSSAPSSSMTFARVPVRAEGGQSIASIDVPARVLPTGVIEVHVTSRSDAASAPADSTSTPIRVISFLVRRD